jgi:hypothetical protein
MAAVEDLMAEGMSANIAKQIGLEAAVTGLTATGSTLAGALSLTSTFSVFGTVASSTGCLAPTKNAFIYNGGASTLTVYPPTSGWSINGLSAGTGISVPANKGVWLMPARGLSMAAIISA